MGTVSVDEFASNPSTMFARVEQGEAIEVTRHGHVIAVLFRGGEALAQYARLMTKGLLRLGATTTSDLDTLPKVRVPGGVEPLDVLLAERAEDGR